MNDRLTACVHKNSKGAYIDFLWDGEPFLTNESGELDLWLENEERTIQKHIDGWVANNVRKSRDKIVLSGQVDLPEFTAKLCICVTYRRVNEACWEKSVCLLQTNIPMLFCSVKSSLRAAKPAKLWSFDNVPHAGGIVHGTYPAIGVTFENGVSAGLLSDAGHRNWWTRNIRRRPNPGGIGFDALVRLCDGKMLELRENEAVWTLGLLTDYAHGEQQALANPSPAEYIPLDGCTANERGFAGSEMCGGCLPYSLQDGFYTFSFDYCSAAPVSVRVLKNTPDSEVRAFHYQSLPAAEGWQHFEDSFFLSDTEGLPTLLKIFEEGPGNGNLEISNIRLTRSLGKDMPYHPLRIGEEQTKRLFIFGQEGADLRTLRLASQTFLADGLGFAGKEEEKVLFADLQMLTWITGETDFTPLNVPSINYAPDMYNRDSFWSCAGVDDKELSEGIFLRWGATQTEEGGIGTIVTPSMGSVEVKENEATCEWLWWAYWNKKHYGSRLPMQKIKKAWKFCNNHFDPQGTGVCEAHFVLGQNDVTTFPDKEKSKTICVNQGVWAVTLKVAAALGLPVKPGQIRAAEERYRSFPAGP